MTGVILLTGLYIQQPNEARVLTLFGRYVGTDRTPGLRWTIPLFMMKRRLSLRARNLYAPTLKVNDKRGNPVEISAAVVWRVEDTARAVFEVDDFEQYVSIQAEAAIRHVASQFAYDEGDDLDSREITLRAGADGFGIGYLLWTGGLLYNTRTFKEAPTSYEEIWNPKYAKRVFLPPATWTDALDTIVAAAKLSGGSATNAEAGFKRLAELKDRVLTFGENPTQIAQLFRSNALDIGGVYAPAFFAKELKDPASGMGATYNLKEGFFADLMYTIMPKNRPGEDAVVHAFINHTLDPVVQGRMAEDVLNGPVNQKAVLSAAAQKSPYIIKPEQLGERAVIHDKALIAGVRESWIKRYTQTFA